MIENYINQIIRMDILADSITIIDKNYVIRYFKVFNNNAVPFRPSEIEKRNLFDVYPELNIANSTIVKAMKGEPTFNKLVYQKDYNNNYYSVIEDVYPIILNKEIIGAVCISRVPGDQKGAMKQIELHKNIKDHTHKVQIDDIIGISPQIATLKRQIIQVADTDINILIYGETGTGKEMVAESIHNLSKRKDEIFFSQNCAAIPSTLLESIFFGSEKGIYTGSVERAGILEKASKGTMFFDEINSLEISVQAKLLKVIEEKKVRRLGSDKQRDTHFRTISAMNESPFECMQLGKIRRDLFYRLSTVIIEIPPLRSRKEDIIFLAEHFLAECNKKNMHQISGLSKEVASLFLKYEWPGNVRELKNVIESAYVFSESPLIEISDLPAYLLNEYNSSNIMSVQSEKAVMSARARMQSNTISITIDKSDSWKDIVNKFENEALKYLLKKESNRSALARHLGVNRQTLLNKIKKMGR